MTDEQQLLRLLTALAIGLLIGLERGWHGLRADKPHIPGVRTFGFIGLLGGLVGLAARHTDQTVFGLAFLAFSGVMATTHVVGLRHNDHPGITSLVATLMAFALGALAGLGSLVPAAATAVVATLLLGLKPWFKSAVARIEELELQATLKLLLISVVLLPVLPDRGFGPGGVLNPYQIWWMVVLIAGISFSGYFAVKATGEARGVLLTSLFAGLASSTSLTLHFARLERAKAVETDLMAAGILLASATLFPRILVITVVYRQDLAMALVPPMTAMALCVLLPALLVWWRRDPQGRGRLLELNNPLELGAAMRFGLLLAGVMLITRLLNDTYGGLGLLAIGGVSGLVDLNAITLTVARMGSGDAGMAFLVSTVVVASISNGLFKGLVSLAAGSPALALRVGLPMAGAAVAGVLTVWLGGHWP